MTEQTETELITCCYCDAELNDENVYYGSDGDNCCEDCFNERFFTCSECDHTGYQENVYYSQIACRSYCRDCFYEIFTYCEHCDTEIYREDSRYIESRQMDVCERCYNEIRSESDIHSYDHKPTPVFHTIDTETAPRLYLGIELEIDDGEDKDFTAESLIDISEDNDLFYLKEDGSLNRGFEIVSHPCTLAFHVQKFPWEKISEICIKNGWKSHDTKTCGLHIHINKSYLSHCESIKLAILVNTNMSVMEKFARRNESKWSKFKNIKKKLEANTSEERYEAINWLNRKTIEFRLFRGTLKADTLLATMQFVHAMVNFVKTVNTQQVIRDGIGLLLGYINNNRNIYAELLTYLKSKNIMEG